MKKLLIFTTWQVDDDMDLSPESNLWYVKRYEEYFDEITHVMLGGKMTESVVSNGNSKYICLGTGSNKKDLLLSPYTLYKFAKEYKPSAYLTVELVWLFWITLLIKPLLGAKVFLLPITYPEAMYKLTKKSLSVILPIWLERKVLSFSYRFANKVITSKNIGSYIDWISADPVLKRRLQVTDTLPEAIPTIIFFESLEKAEKERAPKSQDGKINLLYVGRLHQEKSTDDLIKMMAVLKERNIDAHLTLIGEGPDQKMLENMTEELGLTQNIEFLGWKTHLELPFYMTNADIFVSPSTGGSLREAALCGLPVIAYDLDWIQGLLKDGETFLAVKPNDYTQMADKVEYLKDNPNELRKLAENLKNLGWEIWSDKAILQSIHEIYD